MWLCVVPGPCDCFLCCLTSAAVCGALPVTVYCGPDAKVADATFIHEQLDRSLEEKLEYVMPQVRDLCAAHQAAADAAADPDGAAT